MLLEREKFGQIKDFGLNSYESKLWTALLAKGAATAGELSDMANVPRSRTYDVLESLEKKGFLIMKIGKPIKYLAVDPEHVLERVRKKILEDAQQQSMILSQLETSDVLQELKLLHQTGIDNINPTDLSGTFKNRRALINYIERSIKNAKKTVTIQTTESGLFLEKELKSALKKAKQNNVKVKIAAPVSLQNREQAKDLMKYADVRSTSSLNRMFIVDSEEVVFLLMDDKEVHKSYDASIWVKSPFFAGALQQMFDQSWNGMKRI